MVNNPAHYRLHNNKLPQHVKEIWKHTCGMTKIEIYLKVNRKATIERPIYFTFSQQICDPFSVYCSNAARGADSPHVGSIDSHFQGTEQCFGEDNLASGMNAVQQPFMEATKRAGVCSSFIYHV